MKSKDEIEKLLEQAVPSITEGPHRRHLRTELLQAMQAKEIEMSKWETIRSSRVLKVAAAILAAVVLVSTGWAAERVYSKFAKAYHVTLEKGPEGDWTLPEGTVIHYGGSIGTSVSGPEGEIDALTEKARKHHEEMKELIAKGGYELTRTRIRPGTGEKDYIYRFTYSDGETGGMNFSMPLEEVTSWEDYQEKARQQADQRRKAIGEAVARGAFRLVNLDVLMSHVCRNTATGEKLQILRIRLFDGREIASVTAYPIGNSEDRYTMSWEDHLQAIADGDRELLDLETVREYYYETTLADGSTTIWSYAGDSPIKKPE